MTLTVGCPPDPVGQQGPPIDYGDGLLWRQATAKIWGPGLENLTHTPVA
jgi:hypothetical protein